MENITLPSPVLNQAEDLKWFLHNAVRSAKKGKYNKRAWDLLQIAIDAYKLKLIVNGDDTKRT
jgi:hypothetical protein